MEIYPLFFILFSHCPIYTNIDVPFLTWKKYLKKYTEVRFQESTKEQVDLGKVNLASIDSVSLYFFSFSVAFFFSRKLRFYQKYRAENSVYFYFKTSCYIMILFPNGKDHHVVIWKQTIITPACLLGNLSLKVGGLFSYIHTRFFRYNFKERWRSAI